MPLEFRRGFIAFAYAGAVLAAPGSLFAAPLPERAAYVIGSLDGSVARVDLDSGDVLLNVAVTGLTPNRIETTADLAFAFIVSSGGDRVDVFDLATESITASIPLPAGSNPWTCEVTDGRVFVSGLLTDRVYEIDPWSATVIDEIGVGVAPEGMCVADGKLFVANTGFDFGTFSYGPGTVSAIDLATNAVVATIPVVTNPQECSTLPDGTVHVVCTGDFFLTTGAVEIIDPPTHGIVESIPIPAYPGTAAANESGLVYLGITTASFGSEIWAYDATTRLLVHDGSNPILPSLDFYGNLRVAEDGTLLVPDFTLDLLLVVDPADPSAPAPFLVGDGPADLAVVERGPPVSLALSGLVATSEAEGVRLTWKASPETDLVRCVVERADPGRAFERVANDVAVEPEPSWIDRGALRGRTYTYRVGGVSVRGDVTWLPAVTVAHRDATPVAFARALPNPFRASTTLRFHARAGDAASFEILDVAGRRVLAHDLGTMTGSSADWVWDGRDARGDAVAPGAYFVRATLGGRSTVARLLRMR